MFKGVATAFTVQLAQSPLLSAYTGMIVWLGPGVELIIAVLGGILPIPYYKYLFLLKQQNEEYKKSRPKEDGL